MAKPVNPYSLGPSTRIFQPKVAKGRLANVRTRQERAFMFNPSEVSVSHGWDWGSHKIASNSHPLLSGGSGRERTIDITLMLDGDRGRVSERRGIVVDGAQASAGGLSVKDDLDWYESLTYPERPTGANYVTVNTTPPVMVMTLGSLFNRIPCVIDSCSYTVTAFTPDLEPVRASVQLKILAYERRTVFSSDVFPEDPVEVDAISGGSQ